MILSVENMSVTTVNGLRIMKAICFFIIHQALVLSPRQVRKILDMSKPIAWVCTSPEGIVPKLICLDVCGR